MVILISIAIAAGIVFFLLLIGVLWTIFSRRGEQPQEEYVEQEGDDDSLHHRPSSLLEHINAATRNTIVGSPAGLVFASAEKAVSPDPTDGTHVADPEAEAEDDDGMGTGQAYNDPDGEGRIARARCEYLGRAGSYKANLFKQTHLSHQGMANYLLKKAPRLLSLTIEIPRKCNSLPTRVFLLSVIFLVGGLSGTKRPAMRELSPLHTSINIISALLVNALVFTSYFQCCLFTIPLFFDVYWLFRPRLHLRLLLPTPLSYRGLLYCPLVQVRVYSSNYFAFQLYNLLQ